MVKIATYCALGMLGALTACSPGIVDTEPTPTGTYAEYFWPSTTTTATYERVDLPNAKHRYELSFQPIGNGRAVTDVSAGAVSQFTYRTTDQGILLENIGENSMIPLPKGFTLISEDSGDVPTTVARGMNRVIVTGANSLFAIDNEDSLFYSFDAGLTWTYSEAWKGGTISTLFSQAEGNVAVLYAGTHTGGIWRSKNSGETWDLVVKPIQKKITAITVTDTFVYFASFDKVFQSSIFSGDTAHISNSTLQGNVMHLAVVRSGLQLDTTWIIAGTETNGMYRAIVNPFAQKYYWDKSSTSQRIDRCRALVAVSGKYLYTLGEASGTVGLFVSTNQGESWAKATSDPLYGASSLAYDGKGKLLIAGSDRNIVSVYSIVNINAASLVRGPSIAATHVNDISALNGVFSAATDSGIFFSTSAGEEWHNVTEARFTQQGTKRVPLPGGLLVLKAGETALTPDSGWVAGRCEGMVLGKMTALQMRAKVLSPLAKLDLRSYGSTEFADVIPVRYSLTTSTGIGLDAHIMIYFARGIGPVWIRQLTGNVATSEIYLLVH